MRSFTASPGPARKKLQQSRLASTAATDHDKKIIGVPDASLANADIAARRIDLAGDDHRWNISRPFRFLRI
jgi:hypothetical protein